MRAVITVVGKDMVGILSKVSNICADSNVNITEVTQSVLQELFAMIMLVEMPSDGITCAGLSEKMNGLSNHLGLSIHVMHEGIFNSMHRI